MSDRRKWTPLILLILLVELVLVVFWPDLFHEVKQSDLVDADGNLLVQFGTEIEEIPFDPGPSPMQVLGKFVAVAAITGAVAGAIGLCVSIVNKGKGRAGMSKGTPGFQADARDHEHITAASLNHDKPHELQQLDTMLEAGLITEEEYRERRKRIKP